eukprot:gb/GECG01001763.1/.p1 GENE.gb/GECG01001763.1/~~gb/GECG01001763.1/.p1  ORF type:complete len:2176 (+),score=498.55 gb/GECG01001763.1/:1-6528(+)
MQSNLSSNTAKKRLAQRGKELFANNAGTRSKSAPHYGAEKENWEDSGKPGSGNRKKRQPLQECQSNTATISEEGSSTRPGDPAVTFLDVDSHGSPTEDIMTPLPGKTEMQSRRSSRKWRQNIPAPTTPRTSFREALGEDDADNFVNTIARTPGAKQGLVSMDEIIELREKIEDQERDLSEESNPDIYESLVDTYRSMVARLFRLMKSQQAHVENLKNAELQLAEEEQAAWSAERRKDTKQSPEVARNSLGLEQGEDEAKELRQCNVELEEQKSQLQREKEELKAQTDSLREQLNRLQESQDKASDLKRSNAKLSEQNSVLQREKQELNERAKSQEQQLDEYRESQNDVMELKTTNADLSERNATLEREKEQLNSYAESLKQQLQEYENKADGLKKDNSDLSEQKSGLEREKAELREQVASLQDQLNLLETSENEGKELKQANADLSEQKSHLDREKEEWRKHAEYLREQLNQEEDLENDMNQLKQANADLDHQSSVLQREKQGLEDEAASLKQQLQESENEAEQLRTSNTELNEQAQSLRQQLQQSENNVKELRQTTKTLAGEKSSLQRENEELKDHAKTLKQQMDRQQATEIEAKELKQVNADVTDQKSLLQREKEELKAQNTSLREQLNRLQDLENAAKESKRANEQLSQEKSREESEKEKLRQEAESMKQQLKRLQDSEQKAEEMKRANANLEEQKSLLEREKKDLRKQVELAQDQWNRVQEMENEASELKKANANLSEQKSVLQREKEELKDAMEERAQSLMTRPHTSNYGRSEDAVRNEEHDQDSSMFENASLKAEVSFLREQISQSGYSSQNTSEELDSVKRRKEELSRKVDQLQHELNDSRYKNQKLQLEVDQRRRDMENLKSSCLDMEHRVQTQNHEIKQLRQEQSKQTDEYRALNRSYSTLLGERDCLNSMVLTLLEKYNQNLSSRMQGVADEVRIPNTPRRQSNAAAMTLFTSPWSGTELSSPTKSQREKGFVPSRESLEDARHAPAATEDETTGADVSQRKIQELEESLQSNKNLAEMRAQKISALEEELGILRAESQRRHQQRASIEGEMRKIEDERDRLYETVEETKTEKGELEKKCSTLVDLASRLFTSWSRSGNAEWVSRSCEKLKGEVNGGTAETLSQSCESLRTEFFAQNKKSQHNQLVQTSDDELKRKEQEIEWLRKEICELQSRKEEEIKRLENEIGDLKSRRTEEVGSIRKEINDVKAQKEEEMNRLSKEIRDLESRKDGQINQLKKEISDLKSQNKEEVHTLEQRNSELDEELEEQQQQQEEYEHRVEQLNGQLEELKSTYEQQIPSYKKEVQRLQAELRQQMQIEVESQKKLEELRNIVDQQSERLQEYSRRSTINEDIQSIVAALKDDYAHMDSQLRFYEGRTDSLSSSLDDTSKKLQEREREVSYWRNRACTFQDLYEATSRKNKNSYMAAYGKLCSVLQQVLAFIDTRINSSDDDNVTTTDADQDREDRSITRAAGEETSRLLRRLLVHRNGEVELSFRSGNKNSPGASSISEDNQNVSHLVRFLSNNGNEGSSLLLKIAQLVRKGLADAGEVLGANSEAETGKAEDELNGGAHDMPQQPSDMNMAASDFSDTLSLRRELENMRAELNFVRESKEALEEELRSKENRYRQRGMTLLSELHSVIERCRQSSHDEEAKMSDQHRIEQLQSELEKTKASETMAQKRCEELENAQAKRRSNEEETADYSDSDDQSVDFSCISMSLNECVSLIKENLSKVFNSSKLSKPKKEFVRQSRSLVDRVLEEHHRVVEEKDNDVASKERRLKELEEQIEDAQRKYRNARREKQQLKEQNKRTATMSNDLKSQYEETITSLQKQLDIFREDYSQIQESVEKKTKSIHKYRKAVRAMMSVVKRECGRTIINMLQEKLQTLRGADDDFVHENDSFPGVSRDDISPKEEQSSVKKYGEDKKSGYGARVSSSRHRVEDGHRRPRTRRFAQDSDEETEKTETKDKHSTNSSLSADQFRKMLRETAKRESARTSENAKRIADVASDKRRDVAVNHASESRTQSLPPKPQRRKAQTKPSPKQPSKYISHSDDEDQGFEHRRPNVAEASPMRAQYRQRAVGGSTTNNSRWFVESAVRQAQEASRAASQYNLSNREDAFEYTANEAPSTPKNSRTLDDQWSEVPLASELTKQFASAGAALRARSQQQGFE